MPPKKLFSALPTSNQEPTLSVAYNEVGVVATFPARLRILRVVCELCVQK